MTVGNDNILFAERTESLNFFIANARKYPVLSPEDENALFAKAKSGDESAKDIIIASNQLFVYSIAKQYTATGDMLIDLISEGMIGLMTAYDNFDYTKGFKFITFAVSYIRRAIQDYIYCTRPQITRHGKTVSLVGKISKYKERYYQDNGYYPTPEEIMDYFESINIKIPDASLCIDSVYISIDETSDDSEDAMTMEDSAMYTSVCHSVNDAEIKSDNDFIKTYINEHAKCLSDRDKDILFGSYGIDCEDGIPMTDTDLALKYDLTIVRIRQIRNESIDKIQRACIMDKYSKTI